MFNDRNSSFRMLLTSRLKQIMLVIRYPVYIHHLRNNFEHQLYLHVNMIYIDHVHWKLAHFYKRLKLTSNPVYCKIYDYIVLSKHNDALMSSELQFGFKVHRLTNMCTMILKETMAYYSSNQSSVFCSFLDATKAFDRIHYCELFKLVIKRHLSTRVIRLLTIMYLNNFVRMAREGVITDCFQQLMGLNMVVF